MNNTTYTGYISLLLNGKGAVFPITSADGVLLEPTDTTTKLSEKLVEIDKDIEQITKVTNTILKYGDGSIKCTENGLVHAKTTNIPKGLNPTVNEAIYKFKIDNNGHITDIKEAGLEDFGIGMPIKYCGEYPNIDFTPQVGDMYLVNTGFISKYNKGDVNDFAIYDGETFNIILSDIDPPNVNLNNGSSILYGTAPATIYAPTTLGTDGLVLTSDGTKLVWNDIPTTKVDFNTDGNILTIGDNKILFIGDNGISVNSAKSSNNIMINVNSLYSYDEEDFEINDYEISLKNKQEQISLNAGNGININNNNVSVKIDGTSESYLTVGTNGLKLSGIDTINNTLDNRVKTLEEKVGDSAVSNQITNSINALDSTKEGGTHVKVKVTQENGKITNVIVTEDGIASAADLKTETTNRISADNTLTNNLNAEIAARKSADTALNNRVDDLETSVSSIQGTYHYVIDEIYGDGTTTTGRWNIDKPSRIDSLASNQDAVLKEIWGNDHNYDWSQASRIDKLGNAFNWGLRFSKGITLAPHNNGIIVPYGTTEKIYLPKCGVCWVGYTLFSKAPITITVGGISVSLNGELYVVNKDDENNKFYMRRVACLKTILSEPYLTIQSSQGTASGIDKTAYLTDIVIYFEDGSPTKLMQLQESINTTTEFYRYVNSWDLDGNNSNIFSEIFENLSQGFYQLTYSVLGTSVTPSITTDGEKYCVIASLLYPINTMTEGVFNIRNNGSYFTNRNFYTKDCKVHHDIITTNSNNINSFNYTTFLTIYYVPESGKTTLYLRTWNKGEFTVKNVSLKPISWSDTINNYVINASTINNSVINNPNLILGSSTSKLFSGTDDSGNVYLKYTINGILKWTLDENGITMSNSGIPAEPVAGTMFYYSLNKPGINTPLSNLGKRILNVFDIDTSTTNGYYIDPINTQLGLDYEVHQCYVVSNGTYSIINIYVKNGYIIQNPNIVA